MDQLQGDLNELAELEPIPKKLGRPKGSGNKSNSRIATRLRVRLHRERQAEEAEEAEEARMSQETLFSDMRTEGLLFFGETAPTVNCVSTEQEIEMARIWARLLNVRDIQPGENRKAYILEVMKAWCLADCPLLHLASLSLSKRKVDPPDVEQYIWPDGADTPFQFDQEQPEAVTP